MACKDIITIPDDYVYAPNVPEIYRFINPSVYYDNCVNIEDEDFEEEIDSEDDDNIIDFKKLGEVDYDFEDDDDDEKDKNKKKKKHHKKSKNKKHHKEKDKDIYFEKEMSEEERDNIKADLIRLVTERERIKKKLGTIDPGTKKGANKIAEMNISLRQINDDIKRLTKMIGEPEPDLEHGSRSDRFFGRIKQKAQNCWKKFKKFVKRNKEAIIGISIMAIPVVASIVARIILKV